jgi:DnaJ-class molecular chaperone
MRDPYAVLGLPHAADMAAVKARYHELARRHHPDKLHGSSDDERKRNEDLFKEITVAYQVILEGGGGRGFAAGRWTDANGAPVDADGHWQEVWQRVERMFQSQDVWMFMGTVLADVAVKYREARDAREAREAPAPAAAPAGSGAAKGAPHVFDLTVSLEDIYLNRPRKVRLFLKGRPDPVVLRVYCGSYPEYRTIYSAGEGAEYDICVLLHASESERWPYQIDALFGTKDLYTEIAVNWAEYVTGTERELPYMSGGVARVVVPPFSACGSPIVLNGMGATGREDENMYVSVRVEPPSAEAWAATAEEDRARLLEALARLYAPPASLGGPEGPDAQ